jgi:hypothetical protein
MRLLTVGSVQRKLSLTSIYCGNEVEIPTGWMAQFDSQEVQQNFLCIPQGSTRSRAHLASYLMDTGALAPEVKR